MNNLNLDTDFGEEELSKLMLLSHLGYDFRGLLSFIPFFHLV